MPRLSAAVVIALAAALGTLPGVLALSGVHADLDGETCPDVDSQETCAATQDVVLVIDNSYSVADRHADISEWLTRFTEMYDLDMTNPLSPKIGLVTFSGCVECSAGVSARVEYPVTSDAAALRHAIANRSPPDEQMPMTCISCGIKVATDLLSAFSTAGSMPLVLVLTDGEQTVLGGDEAAVYAAGVAKAQGVDLVTLSLGRALADTMDRMASMPTG